MVTLKDLGNGLISPTDSYCFEIYTMDQDQDLQYLRDYECDSATFHYMAEHVAAIISNAFPELDLGDWLSWPISFTDSRKNYIGLVVHINTIRSKTLKSWHDNCRSITGPIQLAVDIEHERYNIGSICRSFDIDDIWKYIFQMFPYYMPYFHDPKERYFAHIEYNSIKKILCVYLPKCEESTADGLYMVMKYDWNRNFTMLGIRKSLKTAVQLAITNSSLPDLVWNIKYDETINKLPSSISPIIEWSYDGIGAYIPGIRIYKICLNEGDDAEEVHK